MTGALTECRLKIADHALHWAPAPPARTELCGQAERYSALADSISEAAKRGERPRIRVNSNGQIML